MKTDKNLIIIPDWMVVLHNIKKSKRLTITNLYNNTKITYAHLLGIKNAFNEKGWVTLEKERTSQFLSLTHTGLDVVDTIDVLFDKLNLTEEELIKYRRKSKFKSEEEQIQEEEKERLLKAQKEKAKELRQQEKLKEGEKNVDNNEGVQSEIIQNI